MKDVLTDLGYKVYLAEDGEKTFQMFKKYQKEINLVILDLELSKMDGYKVCEKIKKIAKDKKCLFISGYSPKQVHENFVLKSNIELFQKPFSLHLLASKVREILDA